MTEAEKNCRILVIDDDEGIHQDFRKILEPQQAATRGLDALDAELFGEAHSFTATSQTFDVGSALQGQAGYTLAEQAAQCGKPYAVAFVDMRMPPGWDGLETVRHLWETDPDLQVVICTAYADYTWEEVSRRLGRTDRLLLLKKPFDSAEVWQLACALTEKWELTRRLQVRLQESQQLADELRRANENLQQEVGERKAVEARLRHTAYHDMLTGLPNRAYLLERVEQCLARKARDKDYNCGVIFLDLDNFKLINDSLGHERGDALLIQVSERLRAPLRALDTIGRLKDTPATRIGGDEFVIVLDGIHSSTDCALVAERLLEALKPAFCLGTHEISVGASIGITTTEFGYSTADEMLRDADTALYRAKSGGKSRYALFEPAMHAAARARLALETNLRRAVDERQFVLMYQPIVALPAGRLVAFEALIRWKARGGQYVSPGEFIPVAEETGMVVPMGAWVLREACSQAVLWNRTFANTPVVRMNVNVSRRQLLEPRFPEQVAEILQDSGVAPEQINLEITESAVIDDFQAATERLNELKKLGVGIQIDDFGTGYSSLSCLHRFPLDVVKIDHSFTATLNNNGANYAVIAAIVTLAHSLNMKVTVEGVETKEQLHHIIALNCDYAQGYAFARPLDLASASALVRSNAVLSACADAGPPAVPLVA